MKKVIFLSFAVLSIFSFSTRAQEVYKVGTNVVSAGIGLGSSIGNYGAASASPGFSAQYERGLWEAGPGVISLGGYLGIKSYKYSYDTYTSKWNYTIIGARGAWHYTELGVDNVDLYGGMMLSYNHLSFSDNSGESFNYGSAVGFTAFVGGRYYFTPNLGAFLELGYGVSYLNLGLSLKF